jgi:hypothetical protein
LERVAQLIEQNYPGVFFSGVAAWRKETRLVAEVQKGKIVLHPDPPKEPFRNPDRFRGR